MHAGITHPELELGAAGAAAAAREGDGATAGRIWRGRATGRERGRRTDVEHKGHFIERVVCPRLAYCPDVDLECVGACSSVRAPGICARGSVRLDHGPTSTGRFDPEAEFG